MGDMIGLGVGMAAMGAMAPQVGEMMKGFNPMGGGVVGGAEQQQSQGFGQAPDQASLCPICGSALPANAKFCFECGAKIEQPDPNEMICPTCGMKTPKGKFCMECGQPLINKCPNCGNEIPTGAKFCPECGTRM